MLYSFQYISLLENKPHAGCCSNKWLALPLICVMIQIGLYFESTRNEINFELWHLDTHTEIEQDEVIWNTHTHNTRAHPERQKVREHILRRIHISSGYVGPTQVHKHTQTHMKKERAREREKSNENKRTIIWWWW